MGRRGSNATYARDIERAKALVAAGRRPSPRCRYSYPAGDPVHEATAQIVQANLAEVGITVELEPLENAQFVKQLIGAQFPGLWTTYHS